MTTAAITEPACPKCQGRLMVRDATAQFGYDTVEAYCINCGFSVTKSAAWKERPMAPSKRGRKPLADVPRGKVQKGRKLGRRCSTPAELQARRDYAKARYDQRRAAGLCVRDGCGLPSDDASHAACPACRAKSWRQQVARHAARVAEGLCTRCSTPTGGSRICTVCRSKDSEYQTTYYLKVKGQQAQKEVADGRKIA